MIIAFMSMLVVQIILIEKTFTANREAFMRQGSSCIHDIRDNFLNSSCLSSFIQPSAAQSDNCSILKLETELDLVIQKALVAHDLYVAYEYGLYSHNDADKTGNFVLTLGPLNREVDPITNARHGSAIDPLYYQYLQVGISNNSSVNHYHLVLYFPDLPSYLTSKMWTLIIITLLFAIILVYSFVYFLRTIFRQKKIAEVKNDFINNLTHEFKTPLFSIGLASSIMSRNDAVQLSPELLKYLTLIDNENNRLKNNVDKILQMALIDSDNFILEKTIVDIHKLVLETVSGFELTIASRSGEFNLMLNASEPFVEGDIVHLRNMLYNLVDNALKYSIAKPVVTIETLKETGTGKSNNFVISVSDNGIGMTRDVQSQVFEKFYRGESGYTHAVKGFGLGLSYVTRIVEAHNGSIVLTSEQNAGSTFRIYLPGIV